MKRIYSLILSLMLSSCLIFLSGCPRSEEVRSINLPEDTSIPISVCLIHGNTANTPLVSFRQSTSGQNLIFDALDHPLTVDIIECDGNPYLAEHISVEPMGKGYSGTTIKKVKNDNLSAIINRIDEIGPKSEEVDFLKALTMSADIFEAAPGSTKILIIDRNVLSTTGLLDYTSGLMNQDPDYIISELGKRNAIPDLTGVTIYGDHLYEVAGLQPDLGYEQEAKIKKITETLLAATGVQIGNLFSTPPVNASDADYKSLPHVSVIQPTEDPIDLVNEPYIMDDTKLSFVGDTANYVNPQRAIEVLTPVANEIKANGETVLIIGSTATGQSDYCLKLSQARAEKVQSTLVSLGVSKSQMKTYGLGCADPLHVDDIDKTTGQLREEDALKNRKVVVCTASSKYAKDAGLS